MTSKELEAAQKRLGLSVWQMADAVGANVRTYTRWIRDPERRSGREPLPAYLDRLVPLLVAIDDGASNDELCEMVAAYRRTHTLGASGSAHD